jgi:hypothetical protein
MLEMCCTLDLDTPKVTQFRQLSLCIFLTAQAMS